MYQIAGAIVVVGLATISVTASIISDGKIGMGWGLLAVIALFFWGWNKKPKEHQE